MISYIRGELVYISEDKAVVDVGGFNSFSIVNIDKCVIEKIIGGESIEYVGCI